jgi:hypothetical protein
VSYWWYPCWWRIEKKKEDQIGTRATVRVPKKEMLKKVGERFSHEDFYTV